MKKISQSKRWSRPKKMGSTCQAKPSKMNRMPPTLTNNPPTKGVGRLTQRKPRKMTNQAHSAQPNLTQREPRKPLTLPTAFDSPTRLSRLESKMTTAHSTMETLPRTLISINWQIKRNNICKMPSSTKTGPTLTWKTQWSTRRLERDSRTGSLPLEVGTERRLIKKHLRHKLMI